MSMFKKKSQNNEDLGVPQNRKIDYNQKRKRLEWEDAYQLWSADYSLMRIEEHGWTPIHQSNQVTDPKLAVLLDGRISIPEEGIVFWLVGNKIVKATYDWNDGIVSEEVL